MILMESRVLVLVREIRCKWPVQTASKEGSSPANGLWTQKVSGLWARFSNEEIGGECAAIRGYR